MKADRLLAENITFLLRTRKQTKHDLAVWCEKTDVWVGKALKGERQFRIVDFDRIADFFGIATFQLFQPGISPLTERRKGGDRRSGRDRRISHAQREMLTIRADIEAHHPRRRLLPPRAADGNNGTT